MIGHFRVCPGGNYLSTPGYRIVKPGLMEGRGRRGRWKLE